ncbi:MAG: oligosaccharide flippase family protein [Methylococcaceae bacterium]|nr:oligosaccharide flippase family protein [Methylococcaceae bacterium]
MDSRVRAFIQRRPIAILARGAAGTFGLRVLGIGLSFLAQVVMARAMGPEHYGRFVYVLAFIPVMAWLVKLGLAPTLIRYIAIYNGQGDWAAMRGILAFAARRCLGASLGLVLAGASALGVFGEHGDRLQICGLAIALLHIPFMALSDLRMSTLRGLSRSALAEVPENLLRPILLMGLLASAHWALAEPVDATFALAISLAVSMVNYLAGNRWLRNQLPADVLSCPPRREQAAWIDMSVPMFFVGGIQMLGSQLDTLLVGALVGAKEAGAYAVALRIADFVNFALVVANSVVAPLIAARWHHRTELQRLLGSTSAGLLWFVLATAPLLAGMGKIILGLFGSTFVEAYPLLLVLLAGKSLGAFTCLGAIVLTMTGQQQTATWVLGCGLALQMPLAFYLIQNWGPMGMAISNAAANVGVNLAILLILRTRLGLSLFGGFKHTKTATQ